MKQIDDLLKEKIETLDYKYKRGSWEQFSKTVGIKTSLFTTKMAIMTGTAVAGIVAIIIGISALRSSTNNANSGSNIEQLAPITTIQQQEETTVQPPTIAAPKISTPTTSIHPKTAPSPAITTLPASPTISQISTPITPVTTAKPQPPMRILTINPDTIKSNKIDDDYKPEIER